SEAASVKIKNKNLNVNISAVEGKGRREKKPGLSWIEIWVEGEIWVLKEKKSPSDPSIGSFSAGIQPLSVVQAFIWKEGSPYWRSGPWD
ncbi:G-type lectin S-receptor-like serine/threonine-protein kinase At1g11330 isoform X10, partial [Fagus crenata]